MTWWEIAHIRQSRVTDVILSTRQHVRMWILDVTLLTPLIPAAHLFSSSTTVFRIHYACRSFNWTEFTKKIFLNLVNFIYVKMMQEVNYFNPLLYLLWKPLSQIWTYINLENHVCACNNIWFGSNVWIHAGIKSLPEWPLLSHLWGM